MSKKESKEERTSSEAEKPVPPARDDVSSEEEEEEEGHTTEGDSKASEDVASPKEKSSKVKKEKKKEKSASSKKPHQKKSHKKKEPAPSGDEEVSEEKGTEIPDDLRCPVCSNRLDKPRLLPCLHAVCQSCLPKLGKGETVKCCVCESVADAGKSFSKILIDYYRQSMVEGYVQAEQGPVCVPCQDEDENEQAVMMCVECNQLLCDLHHQLHKRMKGFKDHKIVPIDKVDASETSVASIRRKTVRCTKHPTKDLSLWCVKCREVICPDCALEEHNEHMKKPADEVAKEVVVELQGARGKTVARIPEVQKSIQEVESTLETVTEKQKVVSDAVEDFITKMHAVIEDRKAALLSQVSQATHEKNTLLNAQQAELQRLLMSLNTSTSYVEEVLKEGSEVEILLEKDILGLCMQTLGSTTWERHPLDRGELEFVVGKEEKGLYSQIWKTAGINDGKTLRRGAPGNITKQASRSSISNDKPTSSGSTVSTKSPAPTPPKKLTAKEKKALEKKEKEKAKLRKKQEEARKAREKAAAKKKGTK